MNINKPKKNSEFVTASKYDTFKTLKLCSTLQFSYF